MRDRRGQLSAVLIVGFVLVLGFALLYSQRFTASSISGAITANDHIVRFHDFIAVCAQSKARDALLLHGLGVRSPSSQSYGSSLQFFIPVYYADGRVTMPSREEYVVQVQKAVRDQVGSCISDARSLASSEGLELSDMDPEISVLLEEKRTVVLMKGLPSIGGRTIRAQIPDVVVSIPARVGHMHDVARMIVQRKLESPGVLDLAFLSGLDVDVLYTPKSADQVVYTLIDYNSDVDGSPLVLLFSTISTESYPRMQGSLSFVPVARRQIRVGDRFEGVLRMQDSGEAVSGGLTFFSYSRLVHIEDGSGRFMIEPKASDIGLHRVRVAAYGAHAAASSVLEFEVVP